MARDVAGWEPVAIVVPREGDEWPLYGTPPRCAGRRPAVERRGTKWPRLRQQRLADYVGIGRLGLAAADQRGGERDESGQRPGEPSKHDPSHQGVFATVAAARMRGNATSALRDG